MTNIRTAVLSMAAACALASVPAAAQDTAAVRDLRSVDVAPRALNAQSMAELLNATYPAALKAAGMSGTVRVAMVIGADGVPRDLRVIASADSAFDAPTLAAVQTLRFSPARVDSQDVAVRVDLPVVWQADPSPEAVAAAYARAAAEAADTMKVVSITDVTEQPRLLNGRDLVRAMEQAYPPEMRDRGIQADVMARVHIGADGRPRAVAIVTTTDENFNLATVQALTAMQFVPARLRGRAVPVQFDIPVQWRVHR